MLVSGSAGKAAMGWISIVECVVSSDHQWRQRPSPQRDIDVMECKMGMRHVVKR